MVACIFSINIIKSLTIIEHSLEFKVTIKRKSEEQLINHEFETSGMCYFFLNYVVYTVLVSFFDCLLDYYKFHLLISMVCRK